MELIKGPYDDGLFFDVGWETDILPYLPKESKVILQHYLNDPISKAKLNSTNAKGETTVIDLHGPFFLIPTPDDYNLISVNEFISIVEEAIGKLAEPDDTEEIVIELELFKQAIIDRIVNNEVLKTSDIFCLKWSYQYDSKRQFDDLFQYDYYVEFIFINLSLNKIYKAVLGAD
jgi:hypothetical protein